MSAASPAQSQVRRNAAAAPSRSPQAPQQHAHAPARQAAQSQASDFSAPKGDEEIRLNLSDLPVMRGTLDVEGFEPSLLSRLFDLIAPLKR
jgi:hypothetical protein